jgi:hypothetical protein
MASTKNTRAGSLSRTLVARSHYATVEVRFYSCTLYRMSRFIRQAILFSAFFANRWREVRFMG